VSKIDAELIERRFSATEPRRGGRYLFHALASGLVICLLLVPLLGGAFLEDGAGEPRSGQMQVLGALLAGWLIGMLLVVGWFARRRRRRCRGGVLAAWEHAQLEDWEAAQSVLDRVMQKAIPSTVDRGQAFMTLAAIAEHEGCYTGAGQIYETLLLRRIGDAVQLQQAQIGLAAAKLRNQELTDAVNMLSRLEQVVMPPTLRAALDVVRLFQQVFMGHHEDAAQDCEKRCQLYRRFLSTQAAHGYGLLAAAMHHLGRTGEAARLWRDATMLIEAERLVKEYPLLEQVAREYPAMEHRL
jgi:hypothetical protein